MAVSRFTFLLVVVALLVLLPSPAAAFGAGNIASISKVEGQNWRHGDIEDMLKTVACLKGHKWTSMMIKRVYFGNWLRDYSQAVDVGTLKGVQADTIRILVWILAFMSFGYATAEFEVTNERLGVYRPEEHIDNPKDYADNQDARQFDPRLRGPVSKEELAVDTNTGMKNYIANEYGGWATSLGYVKHSFTRAIHFGRVYTNGAHGARHREEDLCEALRCLGQGLHTLEDFGAHTNYTELALQELGFSNVFPHTGTSTRMNIQGKHIYPLVTGTFGGVDFLHSVLGEANDHVTQSELDEMQDALGNASTQGKKGGPGGSGDSTQLNDLCGLLGKVPGTGNLVHEARSLQAASDAEAAHNATRGFNDSYGGSRADPQFAAPPGSVGGPPGPGIPGKYSDIDPQNVINKIYPILQFRDKVVRAINNIISKIPGLEDLLDKISETVTLFIFSLLAPFITPLISAASQSLKQGSSAVVGASANHQYEPWTDPYCTDPTHSLLSKDHFSNVLNEPAGKVASAILQYVAPRVIYAWDHPDVPVDQVLNDVAKVFHHPALRDHNCEIHRTMFGTVEKWVQQRSDRGSNLNQLLSSESVREGKNLIPGGNPHMGLGVPGLPSFSQNQSHGQTQGHAHGGHGGSGGPFSMLGNIPGMSNIQSKLPGNIPGIGNFPGMGGHKRDMDEGGPPGGAYDYAQQPPPQHPPAPAGFQPNDPYAYPTAYQQGYEVPYDQQQAPPPDQGYGQQPYGGGYQQHPPPPDQGSGGGGGWFNQSSRSGF